jgi:hypothetical protein
LTKLQGGVGGGAGLGASTREVAHLARLVVMEAQVRRV